MDHHRTPFRQRWLLALGIAVTAAWCGWVSGFHRTTTPAKETWAVSLGAVLLVDLALWATNRGPPEHRRLRPAAEPWPRPGRGGALRSLAGTTPWIFLVLVATAWEVLGIDTGTAVPHLTISALSERYQALNAALLLVWLLVGLGYAAARARRPATFRDRPTGPPGPETGPGTIGLTAAAVADRASHLVAGSTVHLAAMVPALLLPAQRSAGVAFWLTWVALAVVVDQLARRSAGMIPTFEELLRFVSRPRWATIVLIGSWTYAGWHLFAH